MKFQRFRIDVPGTKWYTPIKSFFELIAVTEVALIYLGTLLFALALRKAGLLSPLASRWYVVLASIATLLVVLPSSVPEPFTTAGYLAAVPAIPFIMPYLIGIRLIRFADQAKNR